MHISFNELRAIKHQLPTGSIKRIAEQLNLEEQTVRNYFGANKFENGDIADKHVQPGPNGGFVELESSNILDLAKQILEENNDN